MITRLPDCMMQGYIRAACSGKASLGIAVAVVIDHSGDKGLAYVGMHIHGLCCFSNSAKFPFQLRCRRWVSCLADHLVIEDASGV